MRDPYRPARPVARLLVVALGLLGIVVGPAGSGTHGGASSTGTITGVRTGAVQHASTRARASAKHRPAPRTRAVHEQAVNAREMVAAVRQVAAAANAPRTPARPAPAHLSPEAHPSHAGQSPYVAPPAFAVPPASGIEVRPPSGRAVRASAVHVSPDVAPRGVPRDRAPPASPRI